MNWDTTKGNWNQFKGKVKEQWGRLTDDELDVIAGKRDQLTGKLQERYGVSKVPTSCCLPPRVPRHSPSLRALRFAVLACFQAPTPLFNGISLWARPVDQSRGQA